MHMHCRRRGVVCRERTLPRSPLMRGDAIMHRNLQSYLHSKSRRWRLRFTETSSCNNADNLHYSLGGCSLLGLNSKGAKNFSFSLPGEYVCPWSFVSKWTMYWISQLHDCCSPQNSTATGHASHPIIVDLYFIMFNECWQKVVVILVMVRFLFLNFQEHFVSHVYSLLAYVWWSSQ